MIKDKIISVHNEWDPLEEIVVGTVFDDCQFPTTDWVFRNAHSNIPGEDPSLLPKGLIPKKVIEETKEDISKFVEILEKLDIKVRRPEYVDFSKQCSTPYWESDGFNTYCPRDLLIAVGDMVIEAPMALRSRQFEPFAYSQLRKDCINNGSRWISAPKPKLLEDDFIIKDNGEIFIKDNDPVFDAANVIRMGKDLLYSVSCSGNEMGAKWLQATVGSEYKVHTTDIYNGSHIDSTFTPLKPGLLLANGSRVNKNNLPEIFKSWDVIYFTDIVPNSYTNYPYSSEWLGVNFLMINPELAVVESLQTPLAKVLNKHNIETIMTPLRQCRTLGGGFHCITMDMRRKGTLENYFN